MSDKKDLTSLSELTGKGEEVQVVIAPEANLDTVNFADSFMIKAPTAEELAPPPTDIPFDLPNITIADGPGPESVEPIHSAIAAGTHAAIEMPQHTGMTKSKSVAAPETPAPAEIPPPVFASPLPEQSFAAEVQAHPSLATDVMAALATAVEPFTLRVNGMIEGRFREKLIELINGQNFGFREMELEPQLNAGKLLLPRISEYAAVLVVRALKDAPVHIEVFRSDEEQSAETTKAPAYASQTRLVITSSPDADLNEALPPVTTDAAHKDFPEAHLTDVLTTSALVELASNDPELGPHFSVVLSRLKLELQYRARLKKALALVSFTHRLTKLEKATEYLLEAQATVITDTGKDH